MTPKAAALAMERERRVRGGGGMERLAGYGLLGLSFASGDVIALWRFSASSIGPPYIAIWHRDVQLRWTFHANVELTRSCSNYFAPALHAVVVEDLEVAWLSDHQLAVSARQSRLHLTLRLTTSTMTRAAGAVARAAPPWMWRREHRRPVLGTLATRVLSAGVVRVAGATPSGHRYVLQPKRLWRVVAAACLLNGKECGSIGRPSAQPAIGTILLPETALFATAAITYDVPR